MTPVSRPIIALGILNVDAGRYSFDARAKSLVAQDLLLLLQSTKTPLTASAENSLFQDVFSVIEPANAVLERHAIITYAANVFMAPSWWLTLDITGSQKQSEAALLAVRVDGRVRHFLVRAPGQFAGFLLFLVRTLIQTIRAAMILDLEVLIRGQHSIE